ncbi:MAG: ACT domain-containing protein [Hyphomicrobiales bacterium]|jgi:hypothetical protein|nr:ACT domain-containing protein [Hyphomicrobiales bacterium]
MSGETDLQRLLSAMQPVLATGTYVFATLSPGKAMPAHAEPLMTFREAEGTTLILTAAAAEAAALPSIFHCRMITLTVHSSLDAVGFMAAITQRLAAAGIGVNPVSAFHHDHLFVPEARAEEAMTILREISSDTSPPP